MITVACVISGGQTGADMGGLMAARDCGIPTAGMAAKGWMTERGPNPTLAEFGLIPCRVNGYRVRTVANVAESDATLIFGKRSPGSTLTHVLCQQHDKSALWVGDLTVMLKHLRDESVVWVRDWLAERPGITLNVAGNRESVSPGMQEAVWAFLVEVWS